MYQIPTTRSTGMAAEKYCALPVCKALCQTFGTHRGVQLKSEGWRNTKDGETPLEAGCTVALYNFLYVFIQFYTSTVQVQVHTPGNLSLSGYPESVLGSH